METYIKTYYQLQANQKPAILEKGDLDIDLDESFAMVDYTTTVIGRQYLYNRLKRPLETPEEIIDLEQQIQKIKEGQAAQAAFEQQSKVLSKQDSADLPYLIFGGELKTIWYYKWITYLQVALGVAVILSFIFHWALLILIVLFGFNLYLHFHNKMILDTYRRSLNTVITLYDFCSVMQRREDAHTMLNTTEQDALNGLKAVRGRLKINQSLQLFTSSELYMLPWLIYELLKAFTLIEVKASVFIVKEINQKRGLIHLLYKAIGKTDFLYSIIRLRESGGCCIPDFVSNLKETEITGLYHPLIENCVKNDFAPANNAVLITGSNAAGKSTFLRSLALSNILASSIHTCFASCFKLPLLRTVAAMHHTDDLSEGLSHYLSEVKDMAAVFKLGVIAPCLLLFDEPFNGTNSRERVAIAASMLQYFAGRPGHMTLVASHDFELLQLLEGSYKMYFFNEQVRPDGKLSFDYRLKEGRKVTRNALELIKIEGFPAAVVEMANQIYQKMEAEGGDPNDRVGRI